VIDDLPAINSRYRLLDLIGQGGMGAVYRAFDRLTSETVALKRVAIAVDDPLFQSSPGEHPAIALAQEFEVLVSLRHPNIIAVRDYGFDSDGQPFFTMDLLDQPRTIVEAGHGGSDAQKIDLLLQMLRALAYLHRRGILQRDLKPGNVLVVHEVVKVLDFGLSIAVERADRNQVGSLAYMAPEVLSGEPATTAADLYAVGLIAYELFAGHHPFNVDDVTRLIDDILETPPATFLADLNSSIAAVLSHLLAKTPQERYRDAAAGIRALSIMIDRELPVETAATRESFLQAAKFVGREQELGRLSQALDAALQRRGSAWLVGGESGVGKSRLLDEVRTRALVQGALVVRGQAVSDGGLPYKVWRQPVRR
jgi:serine/threonine protein kinase